MKFPVYWREHEAGTEEMCQKDVFMHCFLCWRRALDHIKEKAPAPNLTGGK